MSIIFEDYCNCGFYEPVSDTDETCKNCNADGEEITIGPGLDDDDWDKK